MASSISMPEGLPVDAASWVQTPLRVQQLVIHLVAVNQQQAEQIGTLEQHLAILEAHWQQRSNKSDFPPYAK